MYISIKTYVKWTTVSRSLYKNVMKNENKFTIIAIYPIRLVEHDNT